MHGGQLDLSQDVVRPINSANSKILFGIAITQCSVPSDEGLHCWLRHVSEFCEQEDEKIQNIIRVATLHGFNANCQEHDEFWISC